jgi:hypothetical protein
MSIEDRPIEDRLSAELTLVADELPPPHVSAAGLERAGRKERTRRRTAVAAIGSAAAVVVAVVGVAIVLPDQGQDGRPAPRPDEPTPGTSVPYWQDGVLHVGETEIETTYRDLEFANGTTLVGRVARGEWFHVVGGELVPLPMGDPGLDPKLSADGDTAAWVTAVDETTRRVVAWDLTTDTAIDEVETPVAVECCDVGGDVVLHGVDAEGRAFWSSDRTFVWKPGSEPVVVTGASTAIFGELWPGGLMYQSDDLPELTTAPIGTFGTVDDDGRFTKVGDVSSEQNGRWSPDGQHYVWGNKEQTTFQVDDLEGGFVRLELDPSAYDFVGIAAWESLDDVIFRAGSGSSRTLLRCSASTGECEVAVEGLTVRGRVPDGY